MKVVLALMAAIIPATAAMATPHEISLPGGLAVSLPGSQTMVRLTAVQDVRCPSTVDCIWEGTIRVELDLAAPGDTPDLVVLCNACDGATRTAQHGRHTLTLLQLLPGREVLDPIGRSPVLHDYTVVLAVDWQ